MAGCAELPLTLVAATDEVSKMEARVVESSDIMHWQKNNTTEDITFELKLIIP